MIFAKMSKAKADSLPRTKEAEALIETILHESRFPLLQLLKSYKNAINDKLGVTPEDIINELRAKAWAAQADWRRDGQANLRTYMNTVVRNHMLVLAKQIGFDKYAKIEFQPVYDTVFEVDTLTPERLLIIRERAEQEAA